MGHYLLSLPEDWLQRRAFRVGLVTIGQSLGINGKCAVQCLPQDLKLLGSVRETVGEARHKDASLRDFLHEKSAEVTRRLAQGVAGDDGETSRGPFKRHRIPDPVPTGDVERARMKGRSESPNTAAHVYRAVSPECRKKSRNIHDLRSMCRRYQEEPIGSLAFETTDLAQLAATTHGPQSHWEYRHRPPFR